MKTKRARKTWKKPWTPCLTPQVSTTMTSKSGTVNSASTSKKGTISRSSFKRPLNSPAEPWTPTSKRQRKDPSQLTPKAIAHLSLTRFSREESPGRVTLHQVSLTLIMLETRASSITLLRRDMILDSLIRADSILRWSSELIKMSLNTMLDSHGISHLSNSSRLKSSGLYAKKIKT